MMVQLRSEDRELLEPLPPTPVKSKRTRRLVYLALPSAISFIVIIGLWEYASRSELVNPLVVPAPSSIIEAFVDLFSSGLIWEDLWVTVQETLLGFAFGAGGGFLLGTFAAWSLMFRRIVSPYVIVLQVTPRVAIAPIFLTWFGFGITSKVVLAATICFFPVFINTVTGLLNVDQQAMELFRSLKATRRQVFANLTLPSALPVIFAGLKTAITLALIGAIVAEFVGSDAGLGLLINQFNFQLATDYAFAVILVLAIVGLIFYGAIVLLERKFVFWRELE